MAEKMNLRQAQEAAARAGVPMKFTFVNAGGVRAECVWEDPDLGVIRKVSGREKTILASSLYPESDEGYCWVEDQRPVDVAPELAQKARWAVASYIYSNIDDLMDSIAFAPRFYRELGEEGPSQEDQDALREAIRSLCLGLDPEVAQFWEAG